MRRRRGDRRADLRLTQPGRARELEGAKRLNRDSISPLQARPCFRVELLSFWTGCSDAGGRLRVSWNNGDTEQSPIFPPRFRSPSGQRLCPRRPEAVEWWSLSSGGVEIELPEPILFTPQMNGRQFVAGSKGSNRLSGPRHDAAVGVLDTISRVSRCRRSPDRTLTAKVSGGDRIRHSPPMSTSTRRPGTSRWAR